MAALFTQKRSEIGGGCIDESETAASCGPTTFPLLVILGHTTYSAESVRSLESRARRCIFTSAQLNKWLLLPNISWTETELKKKDKAMKPLPVTLALLALFLVASYQDLTVAADADADAAGAGDVGAVPVPDSVCEGKCKNRCSQKVAGRCMGLCMMCCGKCAGCVPSGPLAPKDECPCYRDMKSPKSGRPKCP
ncbi:gibberellin-regulated protein 7-like [Triticum dicoccoides]|nr:gibberellin-regulated protein 7-like [Triticum dicoccoides]XP_044319689.1 gibberellin-regulated protein 7-like [Triticum aestivum]